MVETSVYCLKMQIFSGNMYYFIPTVLATMQKTPADNSNLQLICVEMKVIVGNTLMATLHCLLAYSPCSVNMVYAMGSR